MFTVTRISDVLVQNVLTVQPAKDVKVGPGEIPEEIGRRNFLEEKPTENRFSFYQQFGAVRPLAVNDNTQYLIAEPWSASANLAFIISTPLRY